MSSLLARISDLIRAEGPITVAQYMTLCLHDRQAGYYATRPGLGAGGDFLTAPEVSQMFGELIGLWAVAAWRAMGAPDRFLLVELGPGRGVLMEDALRAARVAPDFLRALRLVLVETSPVLRAEQARRLAPFTPQSLDQIGELPENLPLILVANEVFDCLPARQFVRHAGAWREQVIGLDEAGNLAFGLGPAPRGLELPEAADGTVIEQSPAQTALAEALGARLAGQGGFALIIDYGRDRPGFGDTFQALHQFEKVDPLARPGEFDLTFHVDFSDLARSGVAGGATASPILTQGTFLTRLGIAARLQSLAAAQPAKAATLLRQAERLVAPDQMGDLFKVLALSSPGLAPPAF